MNLTVKISFESSVSSERLCYGCNFFQNMPDVYYRRMVLLEWNAVTKVKIAL